MASKSARDVWEAALGQLQVQVTRVNYDTWLRDTTGVSWEKDVFTIAAPTAFASDWLEKRMSTMIRRTLHQVLGQPVEVRFVIEQKTAPSANGNAPALAAPEVEPERVVRGSRLSPRYTFETFIVGSSNRLPHAAAISVAENPGHSYNPLFIYGGVGLGKTHLLHAIGHVAQRRGLHVLYVSSEQFTNEFINAIRDHRNEDFRQKYRSVDVLLIDDIQFIAGKEQTQEEFFHTFNDLHSTGRQLVISSDRPPRSMPTLEDRLRSRFEWGLIADIQLPDYETRLAILRTKSQETNAQLPPEVAEFIAQKVQSNIRELEGALNRVLAYARLNEMPLSLDVAAEVLSDMTASSGRRRALRPDEIVRAVADFYRLDVSDLEGKRRDKDTALARQVAMYLLREETPLSLSEIGALLGGRDHTTVMHGHQKIGAEINVQATLRREVNQLRESLYTRREAVA